MGDHLGRIYLNCQGIYSDRLYYFRIFDAQDRLFDLFCYMYGVCDGIGVDECVCVC